MVITLRNDWRIEGISPLGFFLARRDADAAQPDRVFHATPAESVGAAIAAGLLYESERLDDSAVRLQLHDAAGVMPGRGAVSFKGGVWYEQGFNKAWQVLRWSAEADKAVELARSDSEALAYESTFWHMLLADDVTFSLANASADIAAAARAMIRSADACTDTQARRRARAEISKANANCPWPDQWGVPRRYGGRR